jgi:hypothetical protein
MNMGPLTGLGSQIFSALAADGATTLGRDALSPGAQAKVERDGRPGTSAADLTLYFDVLETPISGSAKDKALAAVVDDAQAANEAEADVESAKPLSAGEKLLFMFLPIIGWIMLALKSGNTDQAYLAAEDKADNKRSALRDAIERYLAM